MEFVIPGNPVGKARARVVTNHGRVHSFTPEKTAAYENLVKMAFAMNKPADWIPIEGAVKMNIVAYFPIPKSMAKKIHDGDRHIKKPDADNVAKSIMDSLNGLAYGDDSQIAELSIKKLYAVAPRVEVEIRSE